MILYDDNALLLLLENDCHLTQSTACLSLLKVEKHIRRLDDDLLRFEEEQMTGPRLVAAEPKQYRDERTTPITAANRPRRGGKLAQRWLLVIVFNQESHYFIYLST